MLFVGALMPLPPKGPVQDPGESMIGKAAQRLRAEGITVVFGSKLRHGVIDGYTAGDHAWEKANADVRAVYDMWPAYVNEKGRKEALGQLEAVPLANPVDFTDLCGDRLQMQRMLEASGVRMTPVEWKQERFDRALESWGGAFVKPRFRGTGRRVQFIKPGDDFDRGTEGRKAVVLQQARGAPPGWDAMLVRILVQRHVDGLWRFPPSVAVRSRGDRVASGAAGAVVELASKAVPSGSAAKINKIAEAAVEFLSEDEPDIVEMGLDFVIDRFYEPWLIDIESKPKVGLTQLARKHPGRFDEELVEIHARPLRYLARR